MRKASLRWLKMKYRKKNIQRKMKTGYYSCFDGHKQKQNTFDMFVRKYADKWLGLFSALHFITIPKLVQVLKRKKNIIPV